jgi:hypothetical protein
MQAAAPFEVLSEVGHWKDLIDAVNFFAHCGSTS